MSDIKLFHFNGAQVTELAGAAVQVEKSLQKLFEANLEALLGIRFLASEHSTGAVHGGRIDTLGVDEDNSPVIIEYKRSVNENVINQGLFYLDWLLDHRKEFQWLVMERLGPEVAKAVDWTSPRLLCIAGDFTRYDEHAVKQIARNIELIRYRKFGDDLLMIELVHAPKSARLSVTKASAEPQVADHTTEVGQANDPYLSNRMSYRLSQSSSELRDIYDAVYQFLVGLGDDVQVKELKLYTAFKRLKNFVCMEIYPQARTVMLFLKLNPAELDLEEGFTRDFRNIGHYGSGDLQVILRSMADFEKAQTLLRQAYEAG
ncbi:transporter [Agrobacterium tumefaciens]|nr:transporter [Agrobacterium tumefaciens]KAJ36579.1 transporter [Agrobacterium tumefaciens]